MMGRLVTYCLMGMVFLFVSCKHDNIEGMLGEDLEKSGLLCPDDDFSLTQPMLTDTRIDFTAETVDFTTALNDEVTWSYSISGTNGARITASGFGNEIPVTWDGSTNSDIFFKAGDTVQLTYNFNCIEPIDGSQFIIAAAKNQDAVVVADFDGGGMVSSWSNASGQLVSLSTVATDSGAAQGDRYMRMVGEDIGSGSYLGQALSSPSPINFGLTTTPSTTYLNAIVRGTPNAIVEFRVYENDNDWFFFQQPVTWSGWKLVSIPYSSFTEQVNIGGQDATDIKQVRVVLRSDNPTPQVVAEIDYISFTENQPLKP